MAITFNWQNTSSNTFLAGATSINVGSTNASGANGSFTNGDILLASIVINAATQTVTPPAGWTILATVNDANNTFTVAYAYHVCTGAEGGSFAFSWTTSSFASWTLLDYQGANTSTPIDVSTTGSWNSNSSTSVVSGSVTPTNASDMLVLMANLNSGGGNTLTAPANMTSRYALEQTSGVINSMGGDRLPATTSAVSETFTASATFASGTYALIALLPPAGGDTFANFSRISFM